MALILTPVEIDSEGEGLTDEKMRLVAETSKALSRSIRHHPRIEKILEQFWELYEQRKVPTTAFQSVHT